MANLEAKFSQLIEAEINVILLFIPNWDMPGRRVISSFKGSSMREFLFLEPSFQRLQNLEWIVLN
jgi:hypothetical protein